MLVYLDADYLVVGSLNDLFDVPVFGAAVCEGKHYRTGEFAGGLLVVHPDRNVYNQIIGEGPTLSPPLPPPPPPPRTPPSHPPTITTPLTPPTITESLDQSDRFLFGEQDFLNIFFADEGAKVLLPHSYGCVAEMLHLYEDPFSTCKVRTGR